MNVPTVNPAVLDALSDSCCRVALAVLTEHDATVTRAELAGMIAESDRAAATDGDEVDAEAIRTALHHVFLPRLAEAGAVVYDHETGLVRPAENSPFDSQWVRRLLADHADADYDETLAALASERRQAALYALLAAAGPLTERALARRVTAHERDRDPDEAADAAVRITQISLTHTHLPMLADLGFVSVDPEDGLIRPGQLPWRRDPWVAASPIAEWAAAE